MATTLSDLRKMRKTDLQKLSKDVLMEGILTASDDDAMARVEAQVTNLTRDIAKLTDTINNNAATYEAKMRDMQLKVDRGAEILMKHQLFLENIDRRERETNLVVLGVPEDGELVDGADNDDGKLSKIWEKINETGSRVSHKRLGKTVQPNKRRPILVRVDSKDLRDNVLEKAKVLKEATTEYKTIYIKKDVHPAVRKEWNRLKEAETNERAKPENAGATIRFDSKERKLYRNDIVIDSWTPHPF